MVACDYINKVHQLKNYFQATPEKVKSNYLIQGKELMENLLHFANPHERWWRGRWTKYNMDFKEWQYTRTDKERITSFYHNSIQYCNQKNALWIREELIHLLCYIETAKSNPNPDIRNVYEKKFHKHQID